ncbi:hypothetical protein D1007_56059 [Hordeum vulgare]|nr:hypothetical protein D1007_56059 [Hordeum vulgare]
MEGSPTLPGVGAARLGGAVEEEDGEAGGAVPARRSFSGGVARRRGVTVEGGRRAGRLLEEGRPRAPLQPRCGPTRDDDGRMGRDNKQGKSDHGKGDAKPSNIYGSSDAGGSSNSRRHKDRSAAPLPSKSGGKPHGDNLEYVLPHVPVSDGAQRLLSEAVDQVDRSPLVAKSISTARDNPATPLAPPTTHALLEKSALPQNSGPLAKPLSPTSSVDLHEADKKRPYDETDVGVISKKSRSPPSGVAIDVTILDDLGSPEAKELRALMSKHRRVFDEEDVVLGSFKAPTAETTPAPSLLLPPASSKYINYELLDIQEALREQPLNKEKVIEMISSEIGPWKSRYASGTPPDLEILIGRLQAVVAQLQGNGGGPLQDTPAPERVLSLIGKLDAALVEIASGRRRLEKDGPRLEERVADLASVRNRQEKQAADHLMMAEGHRKLAEENKALAEKHAELAAQAEKRAHVLAEMTTSCTRNLEAHEHTVQISSEEIDLYAKRRKEADAFLAAGGTPERLRSSCHTVLLSRTALLPSASIVLLT